MKIYINYLKLHLKSLCEYKSSLILSILSQILVFFSYTFVITSMFDKFNNIKGFTLYEVLLTFSIINFGYAINEVFARGLDQFDSLIITGDFDRLLLRPINILAQVIGFKIQYVKVTKIIYSLIIMIYSLIKLNLSWNLLKILTLLFMIFSSIAIFFAIFLVTASYCFITVQGLEIRNVLTDGGKNIAQYPMGVFPKSILKFFTFIIPYSLVNYYPLLFLIDKSSNIIYIFLPLLVLLYIIPAIILFNKGATKYLSTGS